MTIPSSFGTSSTWTHQRVTSFSNKSLSRTYTYVSNFWGGAVNTVFSNIWDYNKSPSVGWPSSSENSTQEDMGSGETVSSLFQCGDFWWLVCGSIRERLLVVLVRSAIHQQVSSSCFKSHQHILYNQSTWRICRLSVVVRFPGLEMIVLRKHAMW